jgi:isopentenyl-diphosphate delta-isomerase type 1
MTDVILVNEQDIAIGSAEKLLAHQQGLLHRAFSVFIMRTHQEQLEILLQQRQSDKYHCGGLWTNSCCSHPRPEENILDAGQRRLQEELGFQVLLREIGVFTYRAEFANGLIEHEVDHILVGDFTDTIIIRPNPNEVMGHRWSTLSDTIQDCQLNPHLYTPWFLPALQIVNENYA